MESIEIDRYLVGNGLPISHWSNQNSAWFHIGGMANDRFRIVMMFGIHGQAVSSLVIHVTVVYTLALVTIGTTNYCI